MNLASYFDHSLLKPDCTKDAIQHLCQEAIEHKVKAVCIPPYYVNLAAKLLENEAIKVATVIGFPLGYSTTFGKVEEIKRAINDGADELDVVINLAALKSGDWNVVQSDLDSMTTTTRLRSKTIKAIFETCLLTKEEMNRLCQICREVGVDFVKTSTGFNGPGADVEIIKSLKSNLQTSTIKVKASGGIRTAEDARLLIEAGADRLGCSATVSILSNM